MDIKDAREGFYGRTSLEWSKDFKDERFIIIVRVISS